MKFYVREMTQIILMKINIHIIVPSIELPERNIKPKKLKGFKKVKRGFEYSSLTNINYLSKNKIISLIKKA